MLTIGIPKSGKLSSGMQNLLRAAGLVSRHRNKDCLTLQFDGRILNTAYLLRTRRVPYFLKEGHLDLGIVGTDVLEEQGRGSCLMLGPLLCNRAGLHQTRVVLFGAQDDPVSSAESIPPGSRIVSEYFRMTSRFFALRTDLQIDLTTGSAEAEVPLAYRFGVGVVDTGKTLQANGLKEICTLCTSYPVLVAHEKVLREPQKKRSSYRAYCSYTTPARPKDARSE